MGEEERALCDIRYDHFLQSFEVSSKRMGGEWGRCRVKDGPSGDFHWPTTLRVHLILGIRVSPSAFRVVITSRRA